MKVEVFQVSQGRRIVKERRVARFTKPRTFKAKVADGYYFARFTMAGVDRRRIVLRRANGRWHTAARHYRRGSCETLRTYKLERPVFGGRQNTPLRVAYRVTKPARVAIVVTQERAHRGPAHDERAARPHLPPQDQGQAPRRLPREADRARRERAAHGSPALSRSMTAALCRCPRAS